MGKNTCFWRCRRPSWVDSMLKKLVECWFKIVPIAMVMAPISVMKCLFYPIVLIAIFSGTNHKINTCRVYTFIVDYI